MTSKPASIASPPELKPGGLSIILSPGQLARRAELYHQLGSMISAGMPLIKALEMVKTNPAVRASTVSALLHHLYAGVTFSESMRRVQGWMPEFDVALLTVGEQSGRMDSSFKLLSNYYATRATIIRDTIAGMLTTTATLHVLLLVFPLGLLTAFVMGMFEGNYALCLPFLIQKAAVFGFLYTVVFVLIFACQAKHGEAWRAGVESITQAIPILRRAQKNLVLSRLAGALEACLSAGVSIIDAWELAAAASGSPRLRRQVSEWRARMERGETPSELIYQTSYFPELFGNLYNTAETSGTLDDGLGRLQAYYQEEGFRTLRVFTRVVNAVIFALVAATVAIFVIRFYMERFTNLLGGFGDL